MAINYSNLITRLSQDQSTLTNPRLTVRVLRYLANRIEQDYKPPVSPHFRALPPQLDCPETAWPWLLKAKPWIFDGINLKSEPYYAYLASGRPATLMEDLAAVEHLDDPSLADISETLTGSRQYGGATYSRVKAVKEALLQTTTTAEEAEYSPRTTKAA